jgi:hypothetical protein
MTNRLGSRVQNRCLSWGTALALAVVIGGGAPASADEPADCGGGDRDGTARLYDPDAEPFGHSLLHWSQEMWRWIYSLPAADNPNVTSAVSADSGQHGPVFFLPVSFSANPSTAPSTYHIPRHKAIGVTPVSLLNDYPCPDPTFHPAPGQSLFDFLLDGVLPLVDTAQLTGTLDGKPLTNLLSYHYVSDRLFQITGDVSLRTLDACITGSPQPAVSASYFFMIEPPPPGHHELVYTIVTTGGVTYGPFTRILEIE